MNPIVNHPVVSNLKGLVHLIVLTVEGICKSIMILELCVTVKAQHEIR